MFTGRDLQLSRDRYLAIRLIKDHSTDQHLACVRVIIVIRSNSS